MKLTTIFYADSTDLQLIQIYIVMRQEQRQILFLIHAETKDVVEIEMAYFLDHPVL